MVLETYKKINAKDIAVPEAKKYSTRFMPQREISEERWQKILSALDVNPALDRDRTDTDIGIFSLEMFDLALLKIVYPEIKSDDNFKDIAERNHDMLAKVLRKTRSTRNDNINYLLPEIIFTNNIIYGKQELTHIDLYNLACLVMEDGFSNSSRALIRAIDPEILENRKLTKRDIDKNHKDLKERFRVSNSPSSSYFRELAWAKLAGIPIPKYLIPNAEIWSKWKNDNLDFLFTHRPLHALEPIFGMAVLAADKVEFVNGKIELSWIEMIGRNAPSIPERRKF